MSSEQRGRARVDRTTVVIVVERGGDVRVFPDVQRAAAHIEPYDVEHGEYAGAFGLDGTTCALSTRGDEVVLRKTTQRDLDGLHRALAEAHRRSPEVVPSSDPVEVANAELQHQWRHRWPRWPAWLDARLHGEPPPVLGHPAAPQSEDL